MTYGGHLISRSSWHLATVFSLPTSFFQLLSNKVTEDSDGVPQAVIEKGKDLWWGLILLMPRVAQGSEAQLGHPSQDRAGLTPGAVRSSHWIFRLWCLLHEESVLLRGDGISSRDQWREALGISLPTGARGLRITVLFLFDHFDVGDLLLLLADLLLQVGLIFLNVADLLLHHPKSSMRFSNFVMDLSTALREVCKVFNLCSISLQDGASVSTSMAFNTASKSSRSLVCLLRHFRREEVNSLCFLLLCLSFSLRTWSITSSNWRPQVVPGARK